MGSVNKVFLVGNLGRDAEQRQTTAGRSVSNFTLATTDAWTDKASGQRQERTEWHRVVVWGRQAESLQPYLTRGKQICVEGRLQTREWNDRDGNKRYTTEVVADRITLLGGRGGDRQGTAAGGGDRQETAAGGGGDWTGDRQGTAAGGGESGPPGDLNEDDIPF